MNIVKIAKEELVYTFRAYFMPVSFLWLLSTKGWPTAKSHALKSWSISSPMVERNKAQTD